MSESPALATYVVHFQAPSWCSQTVAALQKSTVAVRVTVIDNGGLGDATVDARVLRPDRNRGFTGGANVALSDWLRNDRSEWCLLTSHDLRVEPRCVEEMLAIGRSSPSIGLVGANLGRTGGRSPLRPQRQALEARTPASRLRPPPDRLPNASRCSWISGSCMLLRRPMVEDIGPFDERFGSYMEDVDFGYRANIAGWDVVVARRASATTHGTAEPVAAAAFMASNGPLCAAKSRARPPAVLKSLAKGTGRSLGRVLRSPARAIRDPANARHHLRIGLANLGAPVRRTTLVLGWYAHVVARRVVGRPPVMARCHDPWLASHTGDYFARPRSTRPPRALDPDNGSPNRAATAPGGPAPVRSEP